jgi:hypothetical protein
MPPTMSKPLTDQEIYIDLLDEDKAISEQKFVCLSFVSPEKIIKQREEYFFEKFVEQWQFAKEVEKYNQFLGFLGFKYNLDVEKLNQDFSEFLKEEKDNIKTSVGDDFKNYLDTNEEKLTEEYNLKHGFQTSVRGVKIRGTFSSQPEAELRCKMLRETDPNHDVYVGPVGVWMPFHPDAYKTGRVEHLEKELNELMHEKNKNEAKAKQEFDARVKESKRKAIEDNIQKATENKNKLSQTINKDGELVGVKEMNTQMQFLGEEATVEEVRSELFEGDNIVLDKDTDHGLSQLTNQPFDLEPTCESMCECVEETSEKPNEDDDELDLGV